jgi:cell division protein FtsW
VVPNKVLEPIDEASKPQPTLKAQEPTVEVPARSIDLVLLSAVLALVVIGTVMIYSSSAVYALKKHGDSAFFLKRQVMWLGVGLVALWVGASISYRWFERHTYHLLIGSLLLLAGVLVVGKEINSARRWYMLGPLSFQPVELAKLALVTYLAYSLGKKADKVTDFTVGFVPHLVVCSLMMGLLLMQPDLGSSIILGSTTLVLLFVAGAKISYIWLAILSAAPVAYHMIVGTPWRLRRFKAFFNPEKYSHDVAYQIIQSRISIGSGGGTGVGLGEGRQTLGYMPEGHNDFIMASVGEELGFVGFTLILILFAIILWRGVRAALGSRDVFGSYLAFGITVTFALQALINTGVVLGALPAKGLTLPFVSYGGSSLVMALFLVGVLLNISRRAPHIPRDREVVNRLGAKRKKRKAIIVCG